MKPAMPWQMPPNEVDRYVCFGFDVPTTVEKRQLIRVTPLIDNDTIVHHMLLLSAPNSQPTQPASCAALPPLDWRLLYAWAPGVPPLELPTEAGYPVEGGETMHLVLQMHYSNLKQLAGQKDSSGVSLCMAGQLRPFDADILAFGSVNFSLGPHQTTKLRCISDVPTNSKMTFFQAWPHMHTLGVAFDSRLKRTSGAEEVLASTDNYNFYDQVTYPVNVVAEAGDKVVTTCVWNNPTSEIIPFGEATSEEMCFNFLSYYPRNPDLNWIFPSFLADCKVIP
ncbi:MAG: hypothetical protein RMJ98_06165 [Myxococcales bacterium]|nr:hypothetical protein [Polyangiaceae bacterium]MDW8248873.1 hypothetical protein [Myxococcales bacterium]